MDPIYDSPLNPFGIEQEIEIYEWYSLDELRGEEKRIENLLREKQASEPSRKRKNKMQYDSWVRSIAEWTAELRQVRDEIKKMVMSIQYRKMASDDLDTFIQMRISQLREEGATEDVDLAPALRDYYVRHMADGTFVSWLAMDGEKIIGTSGMSFVEKPPYFGCPNGRIGLLSSMFTDPQYRRMGIAKELLTRVVDEARTYGCGTVQITASDMGVLLYTDFGFVKNGNFMQYKL